MRLKKNEIMYYIAIGIILLRVYLKSTKLINLDQDSLFFDILLLISYALLILKIIIKEKWKNIFLYGIIILVAVISYSISNMSEFLTLVLIVIASKNIDIKRTLKFLIAFNMTVIGIHMIAWLIMFIADRENIPVIYRDNDSNNRVRYNFYLGHPNFFSAAVVWTTMMYAYLKFEKLKWYDYLLMIGIAIFIYVVPNSRTSAMLLVALLILIPIFKKNLKGLVNICKFAIPIIFIILITLVLTYDVNPYIDEINKIFNSRMKLAIATYKEYGIHLLGNDLPLFEKELTNLYKYGMTALTIDNAYYFMLFSQGILSSVIFTLFYTKLTLVKGIEKKKILFLTIWSLFAVTETMALTAVIAFPLLFGGELLEKKHVKEKVEGEKYEN